MTEQVVKYMTRNARVFFVTLDSAVDRSSELNNLEGEDRSVLGKLEAFCCCIASLQKDERASVLARLSLSGAGVFSATADRDGIVRGCKEADSDVLEDALEVTLQLPLRGNYTGVVSGVGFDDLAEGYFSRSLQIASVCKVFESENRFICIAVEQLPGDPCDLEEICAQACSTLPFGTFPDDFVFLECSPFSFGCTCSRGALMRLVSSMPPEEREALAENGKIITHCNACGKKYIFEI